MSGIGAFSLGDVSVVAPWMESLLWTSMEASLMAVVVLALQPLLRRHVPARWRFGLWLLVLVRFVPLPLPESSFSLYNWLPRQRAAVVEAPVADKGEPRAAVSQVLRDMVQPMVARPPVVEKAIVAPAPTVAPMSVQAVVVERTKPFAWSRLIGCIYFVGAGVVLGRLVLSTVALRRIVRGGVVLEDADVRIALLGVCRAMKVRNAPEVLLTDGITSPALVGVMNPRLLVPRSVVERLTINELRLVFLHEIAHLRRRDVLTNYGVAGVALVHWFNPLLWLVLPLIRADRELACDELVLTHTGEPAVYGHTLLKLLEGAPKAGSLAPAVGILESRSFFSRRIAMIAGFKKRSAWRLIPAGIVLGLVAACAMTAPSNNAAAPQKPVTNLPVSGNSSSASANAGGTAPIGPPKIVAGAAGASSSQNPLAATPIRSTKTNPQLGDMNGDVTILSKELLEELANTNGSVDKELLAAMQKKGAKLANESMTSKNAEDLRQRVTAQLAAVSAVPIASNSGNTTGAVPSWQATQPPIVDANNAQLLSLRMQHDKLEQERAATIARNSPPTEIAALDASMKTVDAQMAQAQERMAAALAIIGSQLVPEPTSPNVAEFIRNDFQFRTLVNTKMALEQENAAMIARRATVTEMASLEARSQKIDEQITELRKALTREYNDAARPRAAQSVTASQGGELKSPEQIAMTDAKMAALLDEVREASDALAVVAGLGDGHRDVVARKNALAMAEVRVQKYVDEHRKSVNTVMRVYDVHDILDVPDDQKSSLTSDQRNAMKDLADTLGHTALDTNAVLSSFNGMLVVNASDEVHTKVGKVLDDIRMAHQRRANELRDKMEKVKSEVR